jgi:hypothetical protein
VPARDPAEPLDLDLAAVGVLGEPRHSRVLHDADAERLRAPREAELVLGGIHRRAVRHQHAAVVDAVAHEGPQFLGIEQPCVAFSLRLHGRQLAR